MFQGSDPADTDHQNEALAALVSLNEPQEEEAPCEVWPDNWVAVHVFARAGTQWLTGLSGLVGLRYEALPLLMEAEGVPRAEWPQELRCLQIMEAETLRLGRVARQAANRD